MTDAERQALIDAALAAPASTLIDGTSVSYRSLTELQDAVDREQGKSAVANQPHRGLRFTKLRAPGATG